MKKKKKRLKKKNIFLFIIIILIGALGVSFVIKKDNLFSSKVKIIYDNTVNITI